MKKMFLRINIIVSLLLIFKSVKSQNYIPFPDSGIVWRQTSTRFDQATTTQICWDNQFELRGEDTTINGKVYSKLYYSGTYGPNGVCNLNSVNNTNDWAIREDTTKRIYIYEYISGQEYLLYDFNLGINDTIATGFAYCFHGIYDNSTEIITGIDSVLINTVYHKAFNITSTNWMGVISNYVQLIEGIGSTFGLFADNSPNWAEKYDFLNCVHLNGQVVYFQTQPCSLLTSQSENNAFDDITNDIAIYPNPVDNFLQLKGEFKFHYLDYELYNMVGEKITVGSLDFTYGVPGINFISVQNGVYNLKLSNERGEKVFKVLVFHK